MLTIKHIAPDGVEFMAEVLTAEYQPRRNPFPAALPHIAQVIATGLLERSGGQQVFCEGTVYIMNDKGRTIATYRLSEDNGLGSFAAPDHKPGESNG